jgi:hypothetical protein
MKSIHLLLSAALLTLAAAWARAAAQGLEQAFISIGVECCVKGLRARRKGSHINFLWPAGIFTRAAARPAGGARAPAKSHLEKE